MKTCSSCDESKPLDDFWKNPKSPDGRRQQCKTCESKKRNDRDLRRRYGIDANGFDQLLSSQDGRCSICGAVAGHKGQRLNVDHDHGSGHVRGLLCSHCNTAIGLLGDDPVVVFRAAAYLMKHDWPTYIADRHRAKAE